jgi:P27 family predicted phage terminase small subunit
MGKRGPKPKPTALRVLEGNPGRLPINTEEPRPMGEPECPAHLSADGRAMWRQILDSLPPGLITAADAPLLACYCESWATHKAATEAMHRDRDLLGNNLIRNDRPSPYLRIATEAARTMASLSTRLGLSPADRTGIKTPNPQASGKWRDLIG